MKSLAHYHPSRDKRVAALMLFVVLTLGGWLVVEIERTIGLSRPHLWELLKTDRVFDLAMLDFMLTASWAFLVVGERANWRGWRFVLSAALFCVVPSLGICLYVLLDKTRLPRGEPTNEDAPANL